jgi:hypothetical protein
MAFAPVLGLAATGLSMVGSIMGANAKAQGDAHEAQRMQDQSQYGMIQATQTDTAMRRGLAATLANISAVRASTNTATNSPSGAAVANNFEQRSDDVRQQKVKNIMAQVGEDQKASQFYTKAAQSDLLGGLLGAAGGAMSGLSGAFKSGGFGS